MFHDDIIIEQAKESVDFKGWILETTLFYLKKEERDHMAGNSFYLDAVTRVAGGYDYGRSVSGRYASSEILEKANAVSDFGKLVEAARKERLPLDEKDMDAYKQEIYRRIARLPMDPSKNQDSVMVEISDEGFAAMWKDPEYEQWVLHTLARDFAVYNPWSGVSGGNLSIHHFGASREEYRGESFSKGLSGGRKSLIEDEEEGFWERRARINREFLQAREEKAQINAAMRRRAKQNAMETDKERDTYVTSSMAELWLFPEGKTVNTDKT